jgi:hypothetical protein
MVESRENAMRYALCAMHVLAGPETLKQLTCAIYFESTWRSKDYDPISRQIGAGAPQWAPLGPVMPTFLHLPRTAVSGSKVILVNLGFSYFFLLFFAICFSPERALAIRIRQANCHCEESQSASGTTKQSLKIPPAPLF